MNIKFLKPIVGIVILLIIVSCKVEPAKIEFGKDQCSFCVMNIVDKTHAAQYVTKKGKQFKFDAIECMVNDLTDKKDLELAFLLVSDYGNPGTMTDAKTATFLISEEIQSPMGANLSAFSSKDVATKTQKEHTGKLYTWEALLEKFSD